MKNLYLVIFLLVSFSLYGQVNDTVADMGENCLRPMSDSLVFSFANDSIYISGMILANCAGPHALIRYVNQDSISLTATDDCLANCICPFYFSTSFPDSDYNEYHLTLGYICGDGYDHYFDTIISREVQFIHPIPSEDDLINIYPNPTNEDVYVELTNQKEIIQEIIIRSISSEAIIEKLSKLNNQIIKLDLSDYRAGVYLLEIRTNKNIFFKNIVVL